MTRNRDIRNILVAKNYKSLAIGDSNRAYVKLLPDGIGDDGVQITKAYDEVSGKIIDLTPEDLAIKYDVVEHLEPWKVGTNKQITHRILPKGHTDLRPLPREVLHKEAGFQLRDMGRSTIVEKTVKMTTNGVEQAVPVLSRIAADPVTAQKWVDSQADAASYTIRARFEDAASGLTTADTELAAVKEMGLLGHTRSRIDLSKVDLSYQEALASPEEALDRAIQSATQRVATDRLGDYLISKWENTYGHLTPTGKLTFTGKMPKSRLAIEQGRSQEVAKAIALRDKIKIIMGADENLISKALQEKLLTASHALAEATALNGTKRSNYNFIQNIKAETAGFSSKLLNRLANRTLEADLKKINTIRFITGRPIRQRLMNSLTTVMYLGLEGGTKYLFSGRATADNVLLNIVKGVDDFAWGKAIIDDAVETWAKQTKLSPREAKSLITDFRSSGLLDSIGSHQYLEHVPFQSPAAGLLQKGTKKVLSTADKLGFEAGEATNLIGAWTFARNRELTRGVKNFDASSLEDLSITAKQIAGNMGSVNKAAFQRGAMGVLFQFASHNARMLQLMMPADRFGGFGMPVLSGAEKTKVLAYHGLVFGTGGVGVTGLVKHAFSDYDWDSTEGSIMQDGLVGTLLQATWSGVFGENDLDFSTFAPLNNITAEAKIAADAARGRLSGESSNIPMIQLGKIAVEGAINGWVDVEEATGVSGSLVTRLIPGMRNAHKLFTDPTLDIGEKLGLQATRIARIMPIADDYFKHRIMLATDSHMSRNYNRVAETTVAEAYGRLLLGASPESVTNYYDVLHQIQGRIKTGVAPYKGLKRHGTDTANYLFQRIAEMNDGLVDRDELFEEAHDWMAANKEALSNAEFKFFKKSMEEQLIKRYNGKKEVLYDDLVTKLLTDKEVQLDFGYEGTKAKLLQLSPGPERDSALETWDDIWGPGRYRGTDIDLDQE